MEGKRYNIRRLYEAIQTRMTVDYFYNNKKYPQVSQSPNKLSFFNTQL